MRKNLDEAIYAGMPENERVVIDRRERKQELQKVLRETRISAIISAIATIVSVVLGFILTKYL